MGLSLGNLFPVVKNIEVKPGESGLVLEVVPFANGTGIRIMMMGVTQHPDTVYRYNSDGVVRSVPQPLGEFHNPLVWCRDMGGYLDVYSNFSIRVKNNGSRSRYYAAIVWYETSRVG